LIITFSTAIASFFGIFCVILMVGMGVWIRNSQSQTRNLFLELDAAKSAIQALKTQEALYLQQIERATQDYLMSQKQLAQVQQELKQSMQVQQDLSIVNAQLETDLKQANLYATEELKRQEIWRERMMLEFKQLSQKVLDEKVQGFDRVQKQSLDGLLSPFKLQMEHFQTRLNEVHDVSVKQQTLLTSEIQKVLSVGLGMSQEAQQLAKALKGDKKLQGSWGEIQLESSLSLAGLIKNDHYWLQKGLKDQDGKTAIPDCVIRLPDNKHLIVDAKVSLVAYERAMNAENEQIRNSSLTEHASAISQHIKTLSDKNYAELLGIQSPDFVFLFMPIESAYIEALRYSGQLFEEGFKKGVVLVSHTTLMPILRTVAHLWMMHQSHQDAKVLNQKAGELFQQVCLISERFQKLGQTFGQANKHYNDTLKALVGRQGLHGKIERFQKLSQTSDKALATLEPMVLDWDSVVVDLSESEKDLIE
jgi:DNA recombination protein RmuC